jgi:hypothetical protein
MSAHDAYDHESDTYGQRIDTESPRRLYISDLVQLDHELAVGMCVGADGQTSYWILRTPIRGGDSRHHGRPDAVHEQLGPLPANIRQRLAVPTRCAAPRHDGLQCRNRVRRGEHCRHHHHADRHPEHDAEGVPPRKDQA